MKHRQVKMLIVTLHLLLCAAVAGAAAGSAEPPFRFYSAVDGLTQSDVYDIEQDQTGYLWFTTARGLNRYDGRTFVNFTIADGLPSNNLTALHIDADNTVWVGDARGGVAAIRGGRVTLVVDPFAANSTAISDIETIGKRVLVVAEGMGVLEIVRQDRGFRLKPVGGQIPGVRDLSVYGTDVHVAASSGLYRLELQPRPSLQLVSRNFTQAHAADDGTLWVADRDNQIGTLKDDDFQLRAIISTTSELLSLATGANDTVWALTNNKLFSFSSAASDAIQNGDKIQSYESIDGTTSLFVDRENTLWLASGSRLIRFLGDRFRHYRLKTESDSETVWSISEDPQGRLWFGTQTKLLLQHADESLSVIGEAHGIPQAPVRDIATDHLGNIWAGIRGKGLFRVDTDTLQGELIDGSRGLEVLDVSVAADRAVWFSTYKAGVFRYSPANDTLEKFHAPRNTSVYTLDTTADGSVWYGADDVGLVHLVPEENARYQQEIFDKSLGLTNLLFSHIRIVGENAAWVATEEGGLYRYEAGGFTNIGAETPLSDQTVSLIEPLENDSLIVGGEQGLYHLVPGTRRIIHYGQLDGFVGMETDVHATFVDSRGYLWIGTIDGATRMDITIPMPELLEPPPQILSMNTERDGLEIVDATEIAPRQRGVQVEFAAVSLLNPNGIEYSYRLAGLEDEWGAATSNRSVNYSMIPAGAYEFMVRARYPGGDWSQGVASRSFTVLPYFWQRPLVLLIALAIVLLVIRSALVYRTRSIESLNERLRAEVAERTRSIEQARQKLELSNEKLLSEIGERKKADQARAEVETRFRRAFENAPIGMGLLDCDGVLFDANPALISMFWPASGRLPVTMFAESIDANDRDRFNSEFSKLASSDCDNVNEKLGCENDNGQLLHTVVNLSAVRSELDEFMYAVLQVQDVTESLKLTGQLQYQASYDELTGLLNRRSFEADLTKAWERRGSGTPSYLMFMDLDQFKVVNDTSGHAAGDQLLKRVSEILLDSVRGDDRVCRLGGDEFGIILWECPTEVAQRIAESIRVSIEAFRFHWDAETYRIGVSIGGLPIDSAVGDTSELQQLADAACYAAKEAGRNRVHMVAGDKDSARIHRGQVRWVQRLREAMDNNRFAIYGQVIRPLDETVAEPERIEILLRLRDPESRRLIPPGAFLPAAERYGLSMELDQWVVTSLLDTLFVHQSFQADERKYWINLSGSSIGDKRFAGFLTDAIERSPLPPGMINFEITETAVIRSVVEAGKLMTSLREMGCQFALDDFGSGLSSFNYLKKLPVDYVKIDGMFIRDILKDETDRIFVKSIIDIARTLNIKTIAEFIENDEMLKVVRNLGADYAQGFAIGGPFVLSPSLPSYTPQVQPQKQAG